MVNNIKVSLPTCSTFPSVIKENVCLAQKQYSSAGRKLYHIHRNNYIFHLIFPIVSSFAENHFDP